MSSTSVTSTETNSPWKSKSFEYQLLNRYEYANSNRFVNPPGSRYRDDNKLYFQKSTIVRENNGELTILSAHGEVDFHDSINSTLNTADIEDTNNQNTLNETQQFDYENSLTIDEGQRSSAGKDTTSAADNEDSTKSTKVEDVKLAVETKIKKPKRKKVSASKRQQNMLDDYEKLSHSLTFLVRRQIHIPLKKKDERSYRSELLRQVRRSLKVLRKKLKKREKLHKFEEKKRLRRENRRRERHRLRKILKVVYSKRKQRIRNMRNLRIQERKRVADNLMFKAARLRSRANRLTAGRETRFLHRQVQLPKKPTDPLKTTKSTKISPATKNGLAKNSENSANVLETKICEKKKHKKTLTRRERQKKKLDYEVKTVETRVRNMLKQFSLFCKASARRKARKMLAQMIKPKIPQDSKTTNAETNRIEGGASVEQKATANQKTLKKKCRKDKKNLKRLREAWWRKGKLKAAKTVPKEAPKLDDFGSDSDLYSIKIAEKLKAHRASKITPLKSLSS